MSSPYSTWRDPPAGPVPPAPPAPPQKPTPPDVVVMKEGQTRAPRPRIVDNPCHMDDPPRSDFIYVAFLLLMTFIGGMVFGATLEQRRQESIEQRLEVLEGRQ